VLKEEDTISPTSFHFRHCLYDCTGRGVPCVHYRRDLMDLTSEWLYSLSPFSPTLELDFRPDSCRIPCLPVCHCNSANSFWRFCICSSVHRNSRLKKSNKMQQYVDIYLLLNYCTCFGRPSRPSSGVHKTVAAVSGTVLCTPDDGRDGRPKRL